MDITGIADRISGYTRLLSTGHISEIERDILLGDLRELYTQVKGHTAIPAAAENRTITAPVTKAEQTPVAPMQEIIPPVAEKRESPVVAEAVISAPIITGVVEEVAEDLPVAKKEPEPVVVPVPEVKEEKPLLIEKQEDPIQKVSTRIHYDEGSPVRGPKVSSLNEVFTGEERSINSRLGGGEKKQALNDRLNSKDLKGLIDFNKQHVLTNELFGGDSAAFQAAISHINDSPTIEAAFEYIKTELLPKYKWNGELQSTRLFDKLVRQKFGV